MPNTAPLLPALQPLQEAVRDWSADQQLVEEGLRESFEALEAMERHLEKWRSGLIDEREALEEDRRELEQLRADSEQGQAESQQLAADLAAAIEGGDLLREELQQSQGEAAGLELRLREVEESLEAAQQREKRLGEQLETRKAEMAEQRARWEEDFKRLRDLLHEQSESSESPPAPPAAPPTKTDAPAANDPVLGSVVEQFGKLRQQHAGRRAKSKLGETSPPA